MYTTKDYEQFTYNFLVNNGVPKKTVYAIMGCIYGESEFNPDVIEIGSGIGFGLCQWSYERRTALENYGTDFTHQLNFLWSELTGENVATTGATFQWINKTGYISYETFWSGNDTIENLTKGFLWCFERPNSEYAREQIRIDKAIEYSNTYTGGGGDVPDDNSEKVENAVKWAIEIANDDSHGYDQENRWGDDYDCSSLIISAYEQAGIKLKSNGATYTGNLKSVALDCGFKEIEIDDWNDTSNFVRGDIILNEAHHVCMYIGDGQIVQASINENGQTTGGETGDQTGKEIYVRDYYIYSSGWDCCLRLGNGASGGSGGSGENVGEVYTAIENSSYNLNKIDEAQIEFLKTLSFNDNVRIKSSFFKNKRIIGKNFYGGRLKSDDKEYIIENVRNDGLLILNYTGSGIPKFVDCRYILKGSEDENED